MTKHILLFYLLATVLPAQPSIQWQKSLGGTSSETASSIQQTSDGGYIMAGFTLSNNGDVTGYHGGGDCWVVKLNNSGEIQWQNAFGGSSTESAFSVQQTIDNGYIFAGRTYSHDGDVTANHGEWDYWIVKLNSAGHLEWQKTLGGSLDDMAYSIQQTSDGGFVVAGFSMSMDGDVSGALGDADYWIVKLNNTGSIEWEKSLGGTNGGESAYSIRQTNDGGYIVVGETQSTDGDITYNHGNDDCWVVKLNSNGAIEWQRTLGGFASDRGWGIQQTSDSGYVLISYAGSPDGDITGWHGLYDYWVVKLSEVGDIQWQKALGGSDDDFGRSICQTNDGGYVVAGTTRSTDGDVLLNDGYQDVWAIKLNSIGEQQWQKTLGGSNAEVANAIVLTSDGGYIIVGESYSNDGDVSGNHGGKDFWIVKLFPESSPTTEAQTQPLKIYPNPAQQSISLAIPIQEPILSVCISDLLGREVCRKQLSGMEAASVGMDVAVLEKGFYWVRAVVGLGSVYCGKFWKE